jgi:4-hydroxy-tetrahydrodipicolinate reductase
MTYRVVQWSTGYHGAAALRALLAHPQLELVGLHAHSPEKIGRDAGEICGLPPVGVTATGDIAEILRLDADCVLYMPLHADFDDVCRILESGKNIVTTCGDFFHPRKLLDAAIIERLEEACRKGQSSIHATGSSPGFVTEGLPLTLLSLESKLDSLQIDEYADLSFLPSREMVFDDMGMGQPATEHPDIREEPRLAFSQSIQLLADTLGLELERIDASAEVAVATRDTEVAAGTITAGTVAAQRLTIAGVVAGAPLFTMRTHWYCTRELEPRWELADTGWHVSLAGDVKLEMNIRLPLEPDQNIAGLTSNRPVNAIPFVCEAPPGLLTTPELPIPIPRLGG